MRSIKAELYCYFAWKLRGAATMTVQVKRVYDKAAKSDGMRVLVDRLWPRGVSKDDAHIDQWNKDVAPSNELRKWYGHDPDKWPEFRKKYFKELDKNGEAVQPLVEAAHKGKVTFIFSSKETKFNNAQALKEYIDSRS
jgi:uncharacterized protein YeaO (DUF488 family)